MARGNFQARHFGGHAYHGRLAWEGGRWRHEIHNGRDGWWWDVGGAWYFYPQQMDGPPTYVSDVEAMDDAADGPPVADGYPPPPGAYAPPPPPPPDPAASAVGGAIVGGLLGGLLTGRPGGAIAGAAAGGVTGAIIGAQAASRPSYYLAQGNCYYRYPSGHTFRPIPAPAIEPFAARPPVLLQSEPGAFVFWFDAFSQPEPVSTPDQIWARSRINSRDLNQKSLSQSRVRILLVADLLHPVDRTAVEGS